MYIAQSELLKDVGPGTLEAITGQGKEKTFHGGEVVFREGDRAEGFYVLGEGCVDLTMGHEELCFVVDRPGEVFGWSALLEPYEYRATAHCRVRCRLLEIPRDSIEQAAKAHPEDGTAIFRNLARIVTGRLFDAYRQRISDAELEEKQSAQKAKEYGG
jgi:CRP-like cAMP-binding protein